MADLEVASFNMESDISKLEAPTFTTIERNQPPSMLALDWDHQVNLVGKKVLNPMIHCCDQCLKPILIYGRMIPCKHVFCLGCAKQEEKQCPRCGDKVSRVEQAGLGSIFLCTQGGSRYGNTGCRRTYLSSRDLQAHITHRHSKPSKEDDKIPEKKDSLTTSEAIRNAVNTLSKASLAAAVAAANSAGSSPYSGAAPPYSTQSAAAYRPATVAGGSASTPANHIAVINTRQSNLITVPILNEGGAPVADPATPPVHPGYAPSTYSAYSAYPPQGAATQPTPVTYSQGAPLSYNQPPPAYSYQGSYPTAPPTAAAGAYPASAAGAPYPAPSTAAPYPAPAAGAAYPAQSAGYPGTAALPGYAGPAGTPGYPVQGQWTRPPPGAVRPAVGGARPPGGPGSRPPPPGPPHNNYYRR